VIQRRELLGRVSHVRSYGGQISADAGSKAVLPLGVTEWGQRQRALASKCDGEDLNAWQFAKWHYELLL